MTVGINTRSATAAEWVASNKTLGDGETVRETDTGRTKTGDGRTPWALLPHDDAGDSGTLPLSTFVRKTADTARANDVLADDPHLVLSLDPNGVYKFQLELAYHAEVDGGAAVTVVGPSGSTILWWGMGRSAAGGDPMTAIGQGTGVPCVFLAGGTVRTGDTAGTLQVRNAQAVNDATPTNFLIDSSLILTAFP